MSVDKFGRYSESGTGSGSYGKRGGGLPLTSDGDYDISNKRLKFVNDPKDDGDAINLKTLKNESSTSLKLQDNVYNANSHRIVGLPKPADNFDAVNKQYLIWHINQTLKYNALADNKVYDAKDLRITNIADPVDDKDSVTKKYLHSVIPDKTQEKFSFYNFVVHDIGDPKDMNDAVNLQYVTDHCITHDNNSIDCKNKVLTNVKEGTKKSDAATISQIMKVNNEKWDADAKVISNVKSGLDNTDVATIEQVPLLRKAEKLGEWRRTAFDCKMLPLSNIAVGIGKHDALTVGEWHERGLKKDFSKEFYFCDHSRLASVKDPIMLEDAVTVNYLMRILSLVLYDLNIKIWPDHIKPDNKLQWIKENVVTKYFLTKETQTLRSSSVDTHRIFIKSWDQIT